MPERLRVLLDECVSSPRAVTAIKTVLDIPEDSNPPEIVFLADFVGQEGMKDNVWIPKAAEAGYSLVLTADKGRKKRGDKLPELCRKHNLTHILIGSRLKEKGQRHITFAILGAWPSVLSAYEDDALRFKLCFVATRSPGEIGEYRVCLRRDGPEPGTRKS